MKDDFNSQTYFIDVPRKRHGRPWDAEELAELQRLYMQGTHLQLICEALERPKAGTLARLESLGLISRGPTGTFNFKYVRRVQPKPTETEARLAELASANLDVYPQLPPGWKLSISRRPSESSHFVETLYDDSYVVTNPDGSRTIKPRNLRIQVTEYGAEPIQTEETQMKFEQRTYINGVEASTLSDDQIFGEIRKAEKRVEELQAIKTQTKKLAKAIAEVQAYAENLAKYVDER